jgi:cytidylate kinase
MAVLTVSRQKGSLGFEIACATANRMGYRLVLQEVINLAAQRAGSPEVALAAIDELGLLKINPSAEACLAYAKAIRQVLHEFAAEDNIIIIGRGGQVALHDWPNALHLQVVAPLPLRVQRVAKGQDIRPEHALAQIKASDHFRTVYLKRFFNLRWDDTSAYDLVLNTAQISFSACVDLLCNLLSAHSNSPPAPEQ